MSMYEPPTDNSNYIDQLEFQLKQADQRIAELETENERLKEKFHRLLGFCRNIDFRPVHETAKNSRAVRQGHVMSGGLSHYKVQTYYVHELKDLLND